MRRFGSAGRKKRPWASVVRSNDSTRLTVAGHNRGADQRAAGMIADDAADFTGVRLGDRTRRAHRQHQRRCQDDDSCDGRTSCERPHKLSAESQP